MAHFLSSSLAGVIIKFSLENGHPCDYYLYLSCLVSDAWVTGSKLNGET